MGNKKTTQCDRLLMYLAEHPEGITQMEALNNIGIFRLASRISEIKGYGFNVSKEMETVQNRYGEKVRVARYRLVDDANV